MEFYTLKPEYELYHWGIKGMKWGVRRYQNKDGSLTDAGKKRLSERNIRTEDNLVEKTIPKGTKMYRVTTDKKLDNLSKSVYVSYLDADRNLYKEGSLVKKYRDRKQDSDVYEHEFELKNDIRIPSLKTVRDIEQKVVSNNKLRQEVAESYIKSFMTVHGDVSIKDLAEISKVADRLKKTSDTEQRRKLYNDLINKYGDDNADRYYYAAKSYNAGKEQVDANSSLVIEQSLGRAHGVKSSIIKELQKLGYNAMYDNASIGVDSDGGYTKTQEGIEPLIIFDSTSTLKETSVARIDRTQQKQAGKDYDAWRNDVEDTLRKFK